MNANRLWPAVLLTIAPTMLTAQGRRTDPAMLKHWSAPLYWQPQAVEPEAASSTTSTNPLAFVAMAPCRVVDTRASQAFPAQFGTPGLAAGVSRTFPLRSSATCSVPALAQAYSLNITVVPSGPAGFLTAYPTGQSLPLAASLVWPGGSITSNAAIVPAGTSGSIDVYANTATDVVIDINGYYAASDPNNNTSLGFGALSANTTGGNNTAIGYAALNVSANGRANVAVGHAALDSNHSGGSNTAVGDGALGGNTTGSENIAIGQFAAANVSGSNSNNIHIGSPGASSDNNTIRIGDPATQTSFFAAGVRGVTTGSNNAIPVMIDSNGQLGTVSSSERFKEDIQDMRDTSRAILDLRPVTFRYKQPFGDGSKPIQYGLIAEEVAKVFPDLVANSADGPIETVKYQMLDSLLLNELQRQEAEIRALKERLESLESGPR